MFLLLFYSMQEVERAARLLLLEKVVKGSLLGVLLLPLITCLSDNRLQESITTVLSVLSVQCLKNFPGFSHLMQPDPFHFLPVVYYEIFPDR